MTAQQLKKKLQQIEDTYTTAVTAAHKTADTVRKTALATGSDETEAQFAHDRAFAFEANRASEKRLAALIALETF